MRYFFIDFENVGQNGLYFGDSKLSDSVVNIFYTERCMNINMDVIGNILDEDAKLQMHYVKNGIKNALGTLFDAQTPEEEVETEQPITNNGVSKKKKTNKKIHIFSVDEINNSLSGMTNYSYYKPYIKDVTQIVNRYLLQIEKDKRKSRSSDISVPRLFVLEKIIV